MLLCGQIAATPGTNHSGGVEKDGAWGGFKENWNGERWMTICNIWAL